jgi:enterochelin esterase-like enzyme
MTIARTMRFFVAAALGAWPGLLCGQTPQAAQGRSALSPGKDDGVIGTRAREGGNNAVSVMSSRVPMLNTPTQLNISGQADNICVEGSKNLDALLTKVGINHKFTFGPGGHTWSNWRIYLNEWAPLLFK